MYIIDKLRNSGICIVFMDLEVIIEKRGKVI